jgi:K+-transporting ATPase ATPase C chain
MKRNLITSVLAVIVFTILLGLVYPLVITGVAQVAFPNRADGSPIKVDGKVVGSKLLAQAYTKPVLDANGQPRKDADGNPITEPDPKYFQPRPSQTDYNAHGTFFSNRGPNQASARYFYRDQLKAYIDLNGQFNPGLTNAKVPADAVTTSGSGVDPHISVDNARIQARRVAAVRNIPIAQVDQLVDDNTDGRFLGLLGEPGVNVTKLNLALGAR